MSSGPAVEKSLPPPGSVFVLDVEFKFQVPPASTIVSKSKMQSARITTKLASIKCQIVKKLKSAKRVSDKFWKHIYRLHGWPWSGMQSNRYSLCRTILADLVYDWIEAPGLTQSIELAISRLSNGQHAVKIQHAVKMHQMLVAVVGIPAIQKHIEILLVVMDKQATWGNFMFAVNQVLSKVRRRLPPPGYSDPDRGTLDFDS